jgi:hypothetical protein
MKRLAQRRTPTLHHPFVPCQKPELTVEALGVVRA